MKPTEILLPYTRLNKDQSFTVGYKEHFKNEMLPEVAFLLKEHVSSKFKKWLKRSEVRKLLGCAAGNLRSALTRDLNFNTAENRKPPIA